MHSQVNPEHKSAKERQKKEDVFLDETLRLYEDALRYCDELTRAEVLPLFEQHFSEDKRPSEQSKIKKAIWDLYDSQIKELQEQAEEETLDDNYKLQRLSGLLEKLFHNKQLSKGVLITRTSFCAKQMVTFLGRHPPLKDLVRCAFSDSKEKHHLSQFKTGDINLLVTHEEEHACVPLCSFMICYNFDPARIWSNYPHTAKKSECYVIANDDLLDKKREYEKLSNEHALLRTLYELNRANKLKPQQRISSLKEQKQLMRTLKKPNLCSTSTISIHCKKCRQLLCYNTDLKKCRADIIVSSEEFQRKTVTKKLPIEMTKGNDGVDAYTFCKETSCNNQLGSKFTYGYALFKGAVTWKWLNSNEFKPVSEWTRVPFAIEEASA